MRACKELINGGGLVFERNLAYGRYLGILKILVVFEASLYGSGTKDDGARTWRVRGAGSGSGAA